MMEESVKRSINTTRAQFEESFREGSLYNKQTRSKEHLERIVEALDVKAGDRILDLGTGSGYLAFEVARRVTNCSVVGLDIVERTLEKNRKQAEENEIGNIEFMAYDGMSFPFEDEIFDYVITRYALHHFPKIEKTFQEISRVLKKQGHLFIADPTPNEDDEERFVDEYMKMKNDGHIKYYTKEEFETLAEKFGMKLKDAFQTTICFPRLKETAIGFGEIMKRYDNRVIKNYEVKITDDNKYIYITQKVWNLTFEK